MKKIFFILIVVCASVFTLFAAGQGEGSEKPAIGLSISTLNNPFFVTLEEGSMQKAESLGYDLIVLDAQDDPSKQLNDIEDLIRKNVRVILINPTDSLAIVSAIESANNAGIPVITVDRSAEGGEIAAHVASDNVAGGYMAGEYLYTLVGDGARVVELEGVPGASATRDRGKGFNDAISGKLQVVARQTANFNRAEGLTVMENILQAHEDVQGVFAHNDEMALGAIRAIEAAGRTDIVVIGFDATDDAVVAVQNGEMAATVAQKPALIGELSVDTADKLLKGQAIQTVVQVELALITK